jgi:MYXO-CTERM domain-containing protein
VRNQFKVQSSKFKDVLLAWLVVGTGVAAGQVDATATADRTAVRLSEAVRVTLAVEGPAPLRVELSPAVVDDPTAEAWRVRPTGPPAVADLPAGRQRWTQSFRADPYRPGDPLRLAFAPTRVGGAEVPFPPLAVTVTTEVNDPSAAAVRPITGIEELPPVEATPGRPAWPWVAAAGAGVLAAAWWLRRRRPAPEPSAEDEARRGLADAASALARGDDPAAVADRVAGVVRRFLARRHGLPAGAMTTAEVLTAGDWPAEVGAVLTVCDRARFAGRPAAADEMAAAVRLAGGLLDL